MTAAHASKARSAADLPVRAGARPQTTPITPHTQLDQPAPAPLQTELWRRMVSLDAVQAGHSLISAPSSRALHLDPELARGPREAYLVKREFAHLHGDGSGSLHVTLPEARGAEAVAKGWGEIHPAALAGIAPPTLAMLYGPRTDEELTVVWQLIKDSYDYARGPHDTGRGDHADAGRTHRIPTATNPEETAMTTVSPPMSVLDEVATWPGVSTQTTPRGATAIVFDGHELGHVHPDRATLDLPLTDERRAQVLYAHRANDWFSNWVSKPLTNGSDAGDAIALLRESYDDHRRLLAWAQTCPSMQLLT